MNDEYGDYEILISGKIYSSNDLLHPSVASRLIGLSARTLRDYSCRRLIPFVMINSRTYRYLLSDIIDWVNDRQIKTIEDERP